MLHILAMHAIDLLVGFKLLLFKVEWPSVVSVVLCVELINFQGTWLLL